MSNKTQKAITKNTRTWAFYYTLNWGMDKIVIGTFDGKQPERTNMYKELQKCWKGTGVTSTGYSTDLNCPFFVWPQSELPNAIDLDAQEDEDWNQLIRSGALKQV